MNDGVVDLAPFSNRVPQEIQQLVAEKEQLIRSGDWDVFCGPVVGANGNLIVEDGKCLTDGEMLSMDFFVEGVVGEGANPAPTGLGE